MKLTVALQSESKLSDIARVQSGAGFPEQYQGGRNLKYPLYKVSDMNLVGNEIHMVNETNSISEDTRKIIGAPIFPPGSIIFPKVGGAIATNKKRLTTRECCVDNNVMGVIPNSTRIESRLLYYFFLSHDLSEFANNAGLPSITKSTLENWTVGYVPPLPEQRRIVAILDAAFESIATAKAHAEQNLQNGRALFDSHLQSIFSQRGKGWIEKRLDQVSLDFGRGKSKHRPRNDAKLYGGKYPFIQTGDVRNCSHLITEYSQTYNEAGLAQSKLWPRGTLCITIAANIAETGILDFEACFPDSVIGVVADPKQTSTKYLEYLLQSYKAQLQAQGKGSAQANINLATFEAQTFPFPDLRAQTDIVTTLDCLREETQCLESIYQRKLDAIDALKKSLLHAAFMGDLICCSEANAASELSTTLHSQ